MTDPDEPDTCGAVIPLPDGSTAACNRHRIGWHFALTTATWPELFDEDEVCGAWTTADTAEGVIYVMCGKAPAHGHSHYAEVWGFPKFWRA